MSNSRAAKQRAHDGKEDMMDLKSIGESHAGSTLAGRTTLLNDEIITILRKITYKPNWQFHFDIRPDKPETLIQCYISYKTPESTSRLPTTIGSKFLVYSGILTTKDKIFRFIYDHILDLEKHELREWLRYEDKPIYDPHAQAIRINDDGVVNVDVE